MNQMPPKDVKPAESVAAVVRGWKKIESPFYFKVDRKDVPMVMRVLTSFESTEATAQTEKFVRKLMKDNGGIPGAQEKSEGYKILFENRGAIEILSRACRKEGSMEPYFLSAEQISKNLTDDQIGILMDTYLIIKQELGGIHSEMEQYELDAWIETIVKGGAVHFLASSTSVAQIQLLTYMASQLSNSPMDSSSSTQLQDENISEEQNNKD